MSNDQTSNIATWSFGPIHEAVKPLEWLVGKWKSISAKGSFPTISPFEYCEEISFSSFGQPLLNYSSVSWHPIKKCPMHLESGFLRIKPGTANIAFMIAHNFGLTSLEEGVVFPNYSLEVESSKISRISFAKDPEVTGIKRYFKLVDGKLELVIFMKTTKTNYTQHLKAVYEKVQL